MFIPTVFESDENKELKNAQHQLYWFLLPQIFESCKNTFLLCDAVCQKLSKQQRQQLIAQKLFDHRTLQQSHDDIAAVFRYEKRNRAITLFETDRSTIDMYFSNRYNGWESSNLSDVEIVWAYNWMQFFDEKMNALTAIQSMCPKFIHHVMNASAFNPNNNSGQASEQEIQIALKQFFDITPT